MCLPFYRATETVAGAWINLPITIGIRQEGASTPRSPHVISRVLKFTGHGSQVLDDEQQKSGRLISQYAYQFLTNITIILPQTHPFISASKQE